ncbi:UDP-glucose 4-epimerase GalE [Pelagibius marinus]|uniref:UDP-glucose 4-epimerase GalE n=1 Tax=Pelagibius marinus TaxID=2762760 RepID=UPI001872CBC9|nr:UDP-glucose 4-epimerase GalE [Pelagibius marinus]
MKTGSVLITGGAGYIGSHAVLACREAGHSIVVLDNLSKGNREVLPNDVPFYQGDAGDPTIIARIIKGHSVTAVMHFAGEIVVPESVEAPLSYYLSNTCKSRALLQSCVDHGITSFVFSSTAAVYGEPDVNPVGEGAPTRPENPYGRSKLMVEWMLRDAARAHGLRYVILRYFNVAGADCAGRAGQSAPGATHLIKVACEVAVGKRPEMEIFGTDYDTRDGTCVRDFVHVSDLANAHVLALEHLWRGGENLTLNCAYGHGHSVREVLDAIQHIAGRPLAIRNAPRRAGDVGSLIAEASRLRDVLGWVPEYDSLDVILRTALHWEQRVTAWKVKGDAT